MVSRRMAKRSTTTVSSATRAAQMTVPISARRDQREGYESSFVTSDGEDSVDSDAYYVLSESD
eukprot:2519604-Prymnesium_polylepis.1